MAEVEAVVSEAGSQGLRRSSRSNKGSHPNRLGFDHPPTSRRKEQGTKSQRSGSAVSGSSLARRRAVLEAQKAVAEADLELARLQQEEAAPQRQGSTSPELREEVMHEAEAVGAEGHDAADRAVKEAEGVPAPATTAAEGYAEERREYQLKELQYQRELAESQAEVTQLRKRLVESQKEVKDLTVEIHGIRGIMPELKRVERAREDAIHALQTAQKELTATSHELKVTLEANDELRERLEEEAHVRRQLESELEKAQHRGASYGENAPAEPERFESGQVVSEHLPPKQSLQSGPTDMADALSQFAGAITSAIKAGTEGASRPQETAGGLSELSRFAARQTAATRDLPTFTGRPDEWPAFVNVFRSSTRQCGFTDAENLGRLQACLKGQAKEAVRLMLSVPDNVGLVMKTLEQRFGRPELVVEDLIGKARHMKVIRHDDLDALISFTAAVNNIVVTMDQLSSDGHLNNPQLRHELLEKLPTSLKLQWGEYVSSTTEAVNLKTLAKWLTQRADAAVLVAGPRSSARQSSATTLHADRSSSTKKPQCPICEGEHSAGYCKEFKSASKKRRWELVRTKNLCGVCLKRGHWRKDCRSEVKCSRCSGRHHTLLHQEDETTRQHSSTGKSGPDTERSSADSSGQREQTMKAHDGVKHISFMILPVILQHDGREERVSALMDPASSSSYVRQEIAERLHLPGRMESLNATVLGGKEIKGRQKRVRAQIRSSDGSFRAKLEAWTLPEITSDISHVDWAEQKEQFPHLKDVPLQSLPHGEIDLLIGLDVTSAHVVLEDRSGKEGEPVARRLPLGWVCFGPTGTRNQSVFHTVQNAEESNNPDDTKLDQLVARFWESEAVGVESTKALTVAEQDAEDQVALSSKLEGGHIITKIPWIAPDGPTVTNNLPMAERRLASLEKTLARRPEVKKEYQRVLEQHLQKGYVVEIAEEEDQKRQDRWYLPHFPVIRQDKETTKVRVVFDAAATGTDGRSLNHEMHAGPKLQKDLTQVLLRFCREPVALVGDIAEMFLQVKLEPADCKYLRFLWRSNPDERPKVYQFTRLVFGLKASPFLACRAIKTLVESAGADYNPAVVNAVSSSVYVDDLLASAADDDEAVQLRTGVQNLLDQGSFHLRKWRSNRSGVLETVPPEDRAADAMLSIEPAGSTPSAVKTLGIGWRANTDSFCFQYTTPDECPRTKRAVLSKMASIFDPRGQISPFTIRARNMFQELCLQGLAWDDQLPREQQQKWARWFGELPDLGAIEADRCFKDPKRPAGQAKLSVHTFTDASDHAVAAASYVRAEYPDGLVKTTLAFAKARTAPIKKVTIPKLELRGAALGVKVSSIVGEALDIPLKEHVFWTDSQNVLYWLRSHSRNFKVDVANKIAEIQSETNSSQWRHVPGKLNPSDKGTRGMKATDLAADDTWWHGPDYLQQPDSEWPTTDLKTPEHLPGELKKKPVMTFATNEVKSAVDMSRYSSWSKMSRVQAWINRFANNLRQRITRGTTDGALSSQQPKVDVTIHRRDSNGKVIGLTQVTVADLTYVEVEQARRRLIATAQEEAYPETVRALKSGKPIGTSDPLVRLSPVLAKHGDMENLVLGGRLAQSMHLPADLRQPIILPPKHRLTQLIIEDADRQNHHCIGPQHLLAKLREKYWIVNGLSAVKSVRRRCVMCQRYWSRPMEQVMAPLPDYRTAGSTVAFTRTAVDFAGPFFTRQGRGRPQRKRYLCLFTCLETRACHLEMAYSLDTDSFLLAFTRFVKRRGVPQLMVSDNGSNFVSGERELREAVERLDQRKITARASTMDIEWKFNPPRSPHFGGVFEAMIKAAKRAMAPVLSRANLTDEELSTAFVETEDLMNSRPLTTLSSDPSDPKPLTPNNFLMGRLSLPTALHANVDAKERINVNKRWEAVQQLVKAVWKRWLAEFVPLLSLRRKWQQTKRDAEIGDIVLVLTPDTPRSKWPLGRITAKYPGKDGHTRVVDVKVGEKQYRRSIQHLVPLETNAKQEG